MRRSDKEITDRSAIEAIIKRSQVCRLGMMDENGPYVVPLNFGYNNNVLYFHGALKGHKITILQKNPKVCFECDIPAGTVASDNACSWSMKYQSVVGFGDAVFIEDPDEKRTALGIILSHYSDQPFQFAENKLKATAVIKILIQRMTGKHSGF